MSKVPLSIIERLNNRVVAGAFRTLDERFEVEVDFYSNNYLGFTNDVVFQNLLINVLKKQPSSLCSSTGSRLISGNMKAVIACEEFIANKHKVDEALLFGSGYDANLALFSAVLTRKSTVIVDALVHRSIHDGCKLAGAKKWKFKHNDLNDLERLLNKSSGEVFIAVESLYSMDGDFAPLKGIVSLCNRYKAFLIVDEAHAMGVYGLGILRGLGLQRAVFATTITYGKAMGVQGAVVLGGKALKDTLINFGTAFMYSTSPPSAMALCIRTAYEYLRNNDSNTISLFENIKYYRHVFDPYFQTTESPIQFIQLKYLKDTDLLIDKLEDYRIGCVLIKAPTVAIGQERFRICIHAHNTKKEIDLLLKLMLEHLKK